jgi:hypothetical protein
MARALLREHLTPAATQIRQIGVGLPSCHTTHTTQGLAHQCGMPTAADGAKNAVDRRLQAPILVQGRAVTLPSRDWQGLEIFPKLLR